jgi:hypothetical protein
MPLLADFEHHYHGMMAVRSVCRIRVYQLESGMTVVIATELPDNPGTSVTNWAEFLASEMRRRFVAPGGALAWIEHDPERPGRTVLRPGAFPLGWDALRHAGLAARQSGAGRGTAWRAAV